MQYLVLLRGAPASGKSTFIKEHHLEHYTLSADQIRTQVSSPVLNTDGDFIISQKQDKYVWETLHTMLEKRMQDGCFTVIDATHYKTSLINQYKNLVKRYYYRVYIVDFTDVPYEELIRRNNEREDYKRVPEEVIKKMTTCFTDDTEVKKWCTVIKPEQFEETFTLKPLDLTNVYDEIYVFGDIHGCYTCFKNFIDKHPLTDKTCYLFVGDYTDRGLENDKMVQWLLDNYQKKNVVLLKSNHTVHLDHYANDEWDLIRSKEFKQTTYKQLEGFDKKDLRKLCRKFIQMSYFQFGLYSYLVTHGGIPSTNLSKLSFVPTIQFIKGVGPSRVKLLNKLGINTLEDLITYYPRNYEDRGKPKSISELVDGEEALISAFVVARMSEVRIRKNLTLCKVVVRDETGTAQITWYNQSYLKNTFKPNQRYKFYGKVSKKYGTAEMQSPVYELETSNRNTGKIIPIYPLTYKLNQNTIRKIIENGLGEIEGKLEETLPKYILEKYGLYDYNTAIRQIHFPDNFAEFNLARKRLVFEELLSMQLALLNLKNKYEVKAKGITFDKNVHMSDVIDKLPFKLTGAQTRVLEEIDRDMESDKPMNRLLQGDVGSGKTLVAFFAVLRIIDWGGQCVILCPTELLARQHAENATKLLSPLGINPSFLTGNIKAKGRTTLLNSIKEGKTQLIIGTHALFSKNVQYNNLQLAIIDEQHRFGVEQRAKMWSKNTTPPHVLVMTATPIPRTLAMSVYGDLECSVIDELPKGRKPIQTTHLFDRDILTLFNFMRKQIELGRQIYVVYPLIKESEKMDLKDLMDGYESIVREFPLPKYQISIVHGQMKAEDKDYEMQRFKEGITNIMVATTVIEVGVDVPNATVMVIENAERFGLAQLHQLRGRVGRGQEQSYCILRTKDELSQEGLFRINTMCATNNGFEIAQADLQLRGPGNIAGTQQSGVLELKIAEQSETQSAQLNIIPTTQKLLDNYDSLTAKEKNDLWKEVLSQVTYRKTEKKGRFDITIYPKLPRKSL